FACQSKKRQAERLPYNLWSWLPIALTMAKSRDSFSGGVDERLIAPVLKTGRPKGLVSSNLTPSAILLRACASQDWQGSFARSRMPSEASAKEGRQCITFTSLKVSLRKVSATWE